MTRWGSGREIFWKGFQADELAGLVGDAGFQIEAIHVREAQPDEIAVRRIYLTGQRR